MEKLRALDSSSIQYKPRGDFSLGFADRASGGMPLHSRLQSLLVLDGRGFSSLSTDYAAAVSQALVLEAQR